MEKLNLLSYGNKYSKIFYKKRKLSFTFLINIFSNILAFIFLLIGRHLYIKSLLGCDGGEFKCIIKNKLDYILDDIYYCTHSAIYFLLFLFILQFKLCSFYQLFIFILIIFELIYKDTGDSFLHHGILNLSALFVFIIVGELFILLLILIIKLSRHNKYDRIIRFNFIILLLIISIYFNFRNYYLCKDWAKGLNETFINNDNNIYSCSIIIPQQKCLIDILSPFLDFSKLLNINCDKRKEKEKYLLKNISNLNNIENIKKIGFPNTIGKEDEIRGRPAMYSKDLFDFVKNNLINMDDEKQNYSYYQNKKPEIYVDFSSNPYGELKIKINYSKKLSEQRNLLSKNNTSDNILFIFIDNVSRLQFYRQFKKTVKFLKKFFSFKGFSTKNNPNQAYHGFEFLKYHNFLGATLQNVIPMFSGVYFNKDNHMVSIVKEMKKLGYVTSNVQDICHKELMAIGEINNYSYIEFDHEFAAPNCDPNVYKYAFGFFSGENMIFRKCLYGRESFEYSLEYAKKFWISYKHNKKFLRIVNTYAHEYSGEKAKYSDNSLYSFLYSMYNNNLLQNTTVFIAADHGNALMGVVKLFNSNDWQIEQSLPIFILLNSDKNNLSYLEQYYEIQKNQQTLITPFDIYYTIRYIIYGENYKKNLLKEQNDEGECLFKYINQKERNCSKYKMFNNCKCKLIK